MASSIIQLGLCWILCRTHIIPVVCVYSSVFIVCTCVHVMLTLWPITTTECSLYESYFYFFGLVVGV